MNNRKSEIMKLILSALGVAGLITVAILVPNALQVFARFAKSSRKFTGQQLTRSLKNLHKNGFVSMKEEGGKVVLRLTKLGKEKVLRFKLDELKINQQKHWDRKWRLVIFDIPKMFKRNSYYFSRKLKEMGFVCFQKSVWVCPYPCEDEIDFLKEIYLVRPYVRIVTAQNIDLDQDLLLKFKLI